MWARYQHGARPAGTRQLPEKKPGTRALRALLAPPAGQHPPSLPQLPLGGGERAVGGRGPSVRVERPSGEFWDWKVFQAFPSPGAQHVPSSLRPTQVPRAPVLGGSVPGHSIRVSGPPGERPGQDTVAAAGGGVTSGQRGPPPPPPFLISRWQCSCPSLLELWLLLHVKRGLCRQIPHLRGPGPWGRGVPRGGCGIRRCTPLPPAPRAAL